MRSGSAKAATKPLNERGQMLLLSYYRLRELGRRPRLHPNGFIQFDITPWGNIRLHVWPDTPIQAQQTHHPIHDHCFDMESRIILGQLRNINYSFIIGAREPNILHSGPYSLYEVTHLPGAQDTTLEEVDGVPGLLKIASDWTYGPGKRYSIRKGTLHESRAAEGILTATIMEKTNADATYAARVAVPEGIKPDNDFRRETGDEEILWAFIKRAIEPGVSGAARTKPGNTNVSGRPYQEIPTHNGL